VRLSFEFIIIKLIGLVWFMVFNVSQQIYE